MSDQNLHTYRVSLRPIGSWHFSNPRSSNLGNQSDYYHGTRTFPTQTALFGTLRRAIGVASGMLKADETKIIESQSLRDIIGPIDWQEHAGSFGQIERISPVFIAKGKVDFIFRAFERAKFEDKAKQSYWDFPERSTTRLGNVSYPLLREAPPKEILSLHKVDGKTEFAACLVPVDEEGKLKEAQAINLDTCVESFKKEHVNTMHRAQSDIEGFYVMQRSRFIDSSFKFVTYLTTNQALSDDTLRDLNKLTVPLHGGDNQFALYVETAVLPAWISGNPEKATKGDRLIALSPVKVYKDYAQRLLRAHTKRYAHRTLVRKVNTELYANPARSKINFWADKGSVFWPSETNEAADWPAPPAALERQGFGYFYHLPTPVQP